METRDGPAVGAPHALSPRLIHELRTPLNQIIGYSEMLMEQAEESGHPGLLPDLRRVHGAGHQLLALLDEETGAPRGGDQPANGVSIRERRTLTVMRAQAPAARPAPPREPTTGPTGGALLVVDDIEANRDVLSRRLERQGYDVSTAENGRQALDMLRAESFDLILLDIMMPEMDGYEVLRLLKADERLRHLPIIMISALSEMESVARCIQMGADDYLPKPFDPVLLKARIGASLEKKRARDREVLLFNQLQENYEHLQELEKSREDLMNMIVHDLRTPLTAVIGGMQTLEVLGDLNAPQHRMMSIAVTGGETLLGMINDLLDVEKLEAGAMQLDLATVSAAELVESAIAQVATLAESKGLILRGGAAHELPSLRVDEGKLRRVLVNLLGNAIKFTPSGGAVTLEVHRRMDDPVMLFSVSDTGEGIPAEAFARIFEKFGQVASRQGGRLMSTGLGLAFSRLAVEAHGGHIEVESTPGAGSTFRFTIPLPSAGA